MAVLYPFLTLFLSGSLSSFEKASVAPFAFSSDLFSSPLVAMLEDRIKDSFSEVGVVNRRVPVLEVMVRRINNTRERRRWGGSASGELSGKSNDNPVGNRTALRKIKPDQASEEKCHRVGGGMAMYIISLTWQCSILMWRGHKVERVTTCARDTRHAEC